MGTLTHCCRECKLVHPLWRTIRKQSVKQKTCTPYHSSRSFLCARALENSCPHAQDTHRRAPFQLLLLCNIRSELSGMNHNHFVMLMDLERAQWRQLLWTFCCGDLKVEDDLAVGISAGPLTRAPGLPHSMVANGQSTCQKLHYFRTCVVSFPLLFID